MGARPTLTLQDIANLAHVQRPVVSAWRRRTSVRGQHVPFPEVVETVGGVERFDREDIVEWLRRTRRGKNTEARLDAPALSVPESVTMDELVLWLCLSAATGAELANTTAAQRLRLARDVDPDDQWLLREVAATKPGPDTLRFIDDLMEASFGASEALERLEQTRTARAAGSRDLTSEAIDLVRAVVRAGSDHLDPEGTPLVHVGSATPLTLSIAEQSGPIVVGGNAAQDRGTKRRAVILGIEATTTATIPNIKLLSLIGNTPNEALQLVDNMVLELGEHELAVVLGSAATLCDLLRGDDERNRAQTLRTESLAVALRLPRGMWREAHRQALGLWVCAGRGFTQRPLVADLSGLTRRELALDDLATDVTGALAQPGRRAFRYLRPHDLPPILSSHAPVVPRGVLAMRLATTEVEHHVDRVNQATLETREPITGFDVLAAKAPGSMLLRRRSLAELKELGHLRLLRGSRLDLSHDDPAGSVKVLSATEPQPLMRLDPFDAAKLYPRAARTEPGDVIFAEKPRPCAHVDDHGGSLVASPSRVLRISQQAGVGPHAVAAIINRLPAETAEWEAWNVPILDSTEVEKLEEALAAATDHETTLRRHLAATGELVAAMIDGVAAGAVTVSTRTTE